MNELMVVYGKSWIYFKTSADTATKAYSEYVAVCEKNGINMDNMNPTLVKLRNSEGVDIDVTRCS